MQLMPALLIRSVTKHQNINANSTLQNAGFAVNNDQKPSNKFSTLSIEQFVFLIM